MRHFFDSSPPTRTRWRSSPRARSGMSTFYPDSQNIFDDRCGRGHHQPPDRQAADAGGVVVQEGDRPAVRLSAQRPRLPAKPAAHDVRGAVGGVRGRRRRWPRRSTCSSSSTPTTSRTRRPRRCAWSGARTPTCTPRSAPASARCGGRSTAAPTRRSSTPSSGSLPTAATSQKWVDRAKDPNDSFRLAGFGHRVYKNFDPRATIIKAAAERVLDATGADDALFEVAKRLEEVALSDEYFVSRKLYPNVDFYSGLIYRAIGFPKNMFTELLRHRPPAGLDRAVEGDARREGRRRSAGRGRSTSARERATTCPDRSPPMRPQDDAPDGPRPFPGVAEPRRGLRRLPRRGRGRAGAGRHRPGRRGAARGAAPSRRARRDRRQPHARRPHARPRHAALRLPVARACRRTSGCAS